MSVLDQMTKGITAAAIMERKANAASGLTPVAGETATSVAQKAALVPQDTEHVFMAREGIADIAKDLRKQAAFLLSVADDLDKMTDIPSTPQVAPKAKAESAQKVAEREADAKFEDKFKAQQAAAQAATFASLDAVEDGRADPEDVAAIVAAGSWVCPTHGDASLKQVTSRKGREYVACTKCDEFEKPA